MYLQKQLNESQAKQKETKWQESQKARTHCHILMDSNNDTVEEPTPTPAPSATKNEVKKKKKPKTCHFLKSACDITHTNSCVVVATKVDDETRTNDDMNISPHTHNDAQSANSASVDEFGRTIKRTKLDNPIEIKSAPTHPQSAENTPDPGKGPKRKKKKKRTKVFTTSELPNASMNMNTTMISPEDALAQVHFPTKLYKEIVMYVKPLLILDVNGILCHRIRANDLPNALRALLKDIIPSKVYREPIGYVARSHIVPRTDITSFLEFLNEYYTLAIWSSAQKKTVKSLVHMLIPEKIRQNILFVWGQDRCECVQQGDGDGNGDGDGGDIESNKVSEGPERKDAFQGIIFMKHLSKVWHYYPLFNKSNTLLIDDSPEKCKKFMENCIHPPPIVGLDMDFVISILEKSEQSQGDDSLGTNGVVQEVDAKQFCDEENQKKQLQFFTKLAARWKIASDHNGDDLLFSFLSENGKEHMNWCC